MNLFNPDSWMDVAVIVLWAILAVLVPSWFAARAHKVAVKLDKSVSNGHSSPLREDVDDIRATLGHIRTDIHSVKSELGDIRHELREERRDRLDLEHRFERFRKP